MRPFHGLKLNSEKDAVQQPSFWQRAEAIYQKQYVQAAQVFFNMNVVQRFSLPKDFSIELPGNYELGGCWALGVSSWEAL